MPEACCLLRDTPHYRHEAFVEGLKAVGYRVSRHVGRPPAPDDVLLIWNRQNVQIQVAKEYEAAGAHVLVAENGWLGADQDGHQLYAIAKNHHNGPGRWFQGAEDRFSPLNVPVEPWRSSGDHILVLPQRGIGPPGVAMPAGWLETVVRRLKQVTGRRISIHLHPGRERPDLSPFFRNCHAAVTWGSGAAIKAIVAGVPVFYELPDWIGAPAAQFGIQEIERPHLGDRLPMLLRLAWAQWRTDEIAAGIPFRHLLELR